ncbi:MAG: histidine phosphatase family protein [Acidobacteria bacterium]|nr:histidine phosphatase family protein [Acidobacteriota bacterium]
MKTLLLMRHGKSDWGADYQADHERPLNERGVRSSRLMGRLLAGRKMAPQHVISSSALRARTTAELAIEAGGWDCPLVLDTGLYGSGVAGVLAIAAAAPDVARLAIIGHQPTWSMTVGEIVGSRVEMKTASVAVVELTIDSWSELPDAGGSLIDLINPRTFFGSKWDQDRQQGHGG